MKIQEKLTEVFDKSQHGHQNQAKLCNGLKNFYNKLKEKDTPVFRKEFIRHLKPCLVVFTREPAVERVMEFAARFAALFAQTGEEEDEKEYDDGENFYHFLFDFLLKNHDAQGKGVRFRICQLVKLLLHVVPRDAALEEELVERITDVMLKRMFDMIPAVRGQAVRALTRLQQPTESNCPIIERYLFLLNCDESMEVRSAVLWCITLSTRTLTDVIKRIRDAKESVRKLAYQILAQKVSIRALTCTRRLYIVEQGLLDQSEDVRMVVKTQLLQAWLRTYQGNILEVLEKLDVIGSYKTTCMAIEAMFDYAKVDDLVVGFTILNNKKVVEFENLTPESATYWCEICRFLRTKGVDGDEHLEKILPPLTEFCQYLKRYFKSCLYANGQIEDPEEAQNDAEEKEFVAEQLLKIAAGYDLSDDAGRRALSDTVRELTIDVDVTRHSLIVPALARILTSLHDSDHEGDRIQMAAEMIQDASESNEPSATQTIVTLTEDEMRAKQIHLAKIRVKVIEMSEDLDEKVAEKNFGEASEIQKVLDALKEEKEEIEKSMEPKIVERDEDSPPELRDDPATVLKCLQITKEVCSTVSFFSVAKTLDGKTKRRRKVLHPTLMELVNSLILPSIASPVPAIREVAVECLGNCCLYSFELSAQHLPLYLQIIQADIVEVRIKALGCIIDILRIFGIEAFAPRKQDKDAEADDASISVHSNEDEEENYVTTMILSKILEMLDEDNPDVRYEAASGLAMILVSGRITSPAIFSRLVLLWYNPTTQDEHRTLNKISCFLDAYPYMCRATHDCIEEALLPTLRTVFDAPNSSPLASVNVQNVAELLVHLTRPSVIKSLQMEKENDPAAANTKRIDWLGESSAHDSIAMKLSNEILRDPQSVNVCVLSRALSMLELSPNLQDNLQDLTVLCEQMFDSIKNKQALRYLKKFQCNVLALIPDEKRSATTQQDEENDSSSCLTDGTQEPIFEKTSILLPEGDPDDSETTFHIQRKKVKRNGRSQNGIRA